MKQQKRLLCLILISSLAVFPLSAYADEEQDHFSLDISNVNVVHQESQKVTSSQLTEILKTASNAVAEERSNKATIASTSDRTTYDYITYDDQYTYFYEEAANQEPLLLVIDKAETDVDKVVNSNEILDTDPFVAASSDGFISDGVGGRIDVNTTGSPGSYLMALMQLPASDPSVVNLDRPTHIAFNYGGFEYKSPSSGGIGSWAADMGLELYTDLGPTNSNSGWKPVVILKKKNRVTTQNDSGWDQYSTPFSTDPAHNQVQNKNGYKPYTTPLIYWWYNYNGKVRMKIDGIAISNTLGGYKLVDTRLVTIIESNASWNISTISRWKLLSTVVSNNNTGKNRTTFSNLQLNGNPLVNGALTSPQNDRSQVKKNSDTSVTIVVNSDIY